MEDFSTPRRATVPVTANIATLAVLAATMLWSAGQRPQAADTVAQASSVPEAQVVNKRAPASTEATELWRNTTPTAGSPAKQVVLKPVGYTPARIGN